MSQQCTRLAILGWLVFLAGCAAKQVSVAPATTQAVDPALIKDYEQATALALNPTPEKIFDGLVAISPDNPALEWQDFNGVPHVLMATYTGSFSYYEGYKGKTYNTGAYAIWVTATPFVQQLCRDPSWADGDLDLRLSQLLGLPPGGNKIGFVEFWVKPEDLFRPCPDPEIDDRDCGLAMADNAPHWYRQWFNELRAQQYFFWPQPPSAQWPPDKTGYPWTQLGYTFDWKDLDSPVGMSEFVIKENADVIVKDWFFTEVYCIPE